MTALSHISTFYYGKQWCSYCVFPQGPPGLQVQWNYFNLKRKMVLSTPCIIGFQQSDSKRTKVWSKDLEWDAFTEHMSTLNFGFVWSLPPLCSAVRSTLARVNLGTSLCGTCTQTQITYIWAPKWNWVQPSWDKVLPYIFYEAAMLVVIHWHCLTEHTIQSWPAPTILLEGGWPTGSRGDTWGMDFIKVARGSEADDVMKRQENENKCLSEDLGRILCELPTLHWSQRWKSGRTGRRTHPDSQSHRLVHKQ